jgi:hypothetical protein
MLSRTAGADFGDVVEEQLPSDLVNGKCIVV